MDKAAAFASIALEEQQAVVQKSSKVWMPITPVPSDAPSPKERHSKLGKPSKVWTYRDETGQVLFYVNRFNQGDGRKEIRPLSYCHNEEAGVSDWRWQGPNKPWPLYAMDKIAARPEAVVIVCEGEKAADAAQSLFPDPVATTPHNGAKSPHFTDWEPMKGRTVWVWPDNDKPGAEFAEKVATLAHRAGAAEVQIIDPAEFATLPDGTQREGLPRKWDAANALAEGFTAEHAAKLAEASGFLRESQATKETGDRLPRDFVMKDTGVWFDSPDGEEDPTWVSSRLEVTASTRNGDAEAHGRLLEFKDTRFFYPSLREPCKLTRRFANDTRNAANEGIGQRYAMEPESTEASRDQTITERGCPLLCWPPGLAPDARGAGRHPRGPGRTRRYPGVRRRSVPRRFRAGGKGGDAGVSLQADHRSRLGDPDRPWMGPGGCGARFTPSA